MSTRHSDPIKVYDARWEVDEFGDDEVRRLLEASLLYGLEQGVDTVTLTRDARLGCGRIMEIGIDTAVRAGFRVVACADPISTPQSYFMTHSVTREHPRTMGLAVTASHNPSQYVGIKFTVPPVRAIGLDCGPQGGLTRVRELYHSSQELPSRQGGTLGFLELSAAYLDYSFATAEVEAGSLEGLAVVLDTFNGSAGPVLHRALQQAGVRVDGIRLVPDGNFPTGSPNPTSEGKMERALERAREIGADIVLGVDGDGDRLVFGDRQGLLAAGFVFVPILKACGFGGGGSDSVPVLYDPKVNPLSLVEWGRLGVQPVLFRNGHSQIKDYMTRIGAVAAAEESGHYYHRLTLEGITISGENSVLTVLLFLRAIHRDRKLLASLRTMQEQVFTTGEFNYAFPSDDIRDRAMQAVIDHFVSDGAATVEATPDGIDLQGTSLSRGVRLAAGEATLVPDWYCGYLRIATNEKGVVRSYFSAGEADWGREIERRARKILAEDFGGRVVD